MFSFSSETEEFTNENDPLISSNGILEINLLHNNTHESPHSAEHTAGQLQLRTRNEYPVCYVTFNSIVICIASVSLIVLERLQTDHFTFDDLNIISYRTLDGLVLLISMVNILFAILGLLTGNLIFNFDLVNRLIDLFCVIFEVIFRRWLFIMASSVSQLIGFFLSFIALLCVNLVVLVFQILDEQDSFNLARTFKRSAMITIGTLVGILQLIYFIVIQFIFKRNVNRMNIL